MAIDLKNASFVKVIYLEDGRCIKSVFSFQHDGTTNGPVHTKVYMEVHTVCMLTVTNFICSLFYDTFSVT
jgi:hypothetical protein